METVGHTVGAVTKIMQVSGFTVQAHSVTQQGEKLHIC
jgi:hypothetical protein